LQPDHEHHQSNEEKLVSIQVHDSRFTGRQSVTTAARAGDTPHRASFI
jgi:hypothetical protein